MDQKRILIVGAGPAGLTAALQLARHGIVPRVIDRANGPSPLSRAVGIFPKTLKLLPKSVAAELVRKSESMREARIYLNSALLVELALPGGELERPCGYPQNKTEELLRADFEAHGGSVEYGVEFQGLKQSDAHVEGILNGESRIFDYLIGTDGASSKVRAAIGQEYRGFSLNEKWSIADFHADDLEQCLNIWLLDGGQFAGYVPIGPDRYRLFASTEDALATVPTKIKVTKLNRADTFHVAVRRVDEFRVGRVFLAGDAAHIHTPLGGRGMNLAMQDAIELANRLVANDLDGYSKSRHEQAIAIAAFSERLRFFFSSTNPFILAFRNLALRLISRSGYLKGRLIKSLVDT